MGCEIWLFFFCDQWQWASRWHCSFQSSASGYRSAPGGSPRQACNRFGAGSQSESFKLSPSAFLGPLDETSPFKHSRWIATCSVRPCVCLFFIVLFWVLSFVLRLRVCNILQFFALGLLPTGVSGENVRLDPRTNSGRSHLPRNASWTACARILESRVTSGSL